LTGRWLQILAVLPLLLSACSPRADSAPGTSGASSPSGAQQSAAVGAKVLTVGLQREPVVLVDRVRPDVGRGGGISHVFNIAHDYLTVMDDHGEFIPQLATALPSPEAGTWQVHPDGSMTMTWKLQPRASWHDGTPFTAADVVFAFNAYKDPEITTGFGLDIKDVTAVTAPDPHTLVAQWASTRFDADRALGFTPLPEHLMSEVYRADRASFTSSPLLGTEFVGLGPFRLSRWEAGSLIEFTAFDRYYRGKPALDRIRLRFLLDPNTMVANILSGAVDVLLPLGVSVDAAIQVEERWKGTGNTVIYNPGDRTEFVYTQQRPELAQPRNGFPHFAVRQGMFHAIDRDTLAQVIFFGKSPVADTWLNARDPVLSEIQAGIPRYGFDLTRAQQLLTQAGWSRGADGVLIHQPTGERFDVELHTAAASDAEQKLTLIAEGWKAVGAQVRLNVIPAQLASEQAARARLPGAGNIALSARSIYQDMLSSTGRNSMFQGYSSPRYDALVDRLFKTLDRTERAGIHREMVEVGMGEVALMPLGYRVDPYLFVRGVKGVRGHPETQATWNVFEWDKDG
jgi:peptide/nickel transport system substrate-binding protein